MKTEAYKLYSNAFWIFLPIVIKIDPYNFELYRFKVGVFFETQCILLSPRAFPTANKQNYNCSSLISGLQLDFCYKISLGILRCSHYAVVRIKQMPH